MRVGCVAVAVAVACEALVAAEAARAAWRNETGT